jgi:hypothetical protein
LGSGRPIKKKDAHENPEGGQVQWARADGKGYADLVQGVGRPSQGYRGGRSGRGPDDFSRCQVSRVVVMPPELGMGQRLWKLKLSEVDVWVRASGADAPGEEKEGGR